MGTFFFFNIKLLIFRYCKILGACIEDKQLTWMCSPPQPDSLTEMTGYSLEDLMPCVEDLHRLYLSAAQHAQQSVREKYKTAK